MLDVLRRGASTWISKLLLGLLIVSFGVWGIADVFRGFGSNTAYHVGSREIGVMELDQEYQRELQQMSRRLGRPINKDEALKTGISRQILSRIVSEATLAEATRGFGLGVSNATVLQELLRDPAFKGPNGAFDRARFVELLRANGWNEDMFVVRRRADVARSQLIEGMVGGQPAPKVLVEALDTYRNETRMVKYAVLSAASLGEIAPPSDADLEKFFTERARAFRAPERRSITALVLDAASIARADDVTDDDAKAEYDRRKDTWTTPEKRRVLQVRVPDEAAGKAFLAELAAGKTFAVAAEALGQKSEDLDLGLISRSAFADPKVADAAFALASPGTVSDVVAGRFGPVVLMLAEVAPGKTRTLAEVMPELKKEIAAHRAEADLLPRHDQIEDALAGGAKLAEVAERLSMKPRVFDRIDRQGRLADGTAPADVPRWADMVSGAFESDVGVENDVLDLGGKGFAWYAVTAVEQARDQTLAEVRDRVLAAWKTEEVTRRLSETAKALTERLAKGEDFDEIAKSAGLEVKTSAAFKRGEAADGLPAAAIVTAFEGPDGHVGTAVAENGDTVLLKVVDVTAPAFFAESDEAKGNADRISASIRNSLAETWLNLVRADIGVTGNQSVIDRVTGHARD